MMARLSSLRLLALLGAALLAPPVLAQSLSPDEAGDFSVDRFRLSPDGEGLLDVEVAPVRGERFAFDAGGALHYLSDPLLLSWGEDDRFSPLLSHRAALDLFAAMTVHPRFSLGLSGRFVIFQSRPTTFIASGITHTLPELSTTGMGDLRVVPKLWLLRVDQVLVDVAILPSVWIPLGGGKAYRGERGVAFEPELVISRSFEQLTLALNVSYLLRPRSELLDLVIDDELRFRLGFGYAVTEGGATVEASLLFATAPSAFGETANTSLEAMLGVSQPLGDHLQLRFAGGTGILRGFGSPDLRVFTALRYAP